MERAEATVVTSLGAVLGIQERGVYSWRGIPYAHSLDAEHRFAVPEPLEKWDGELDASHFSGICPQKGFLRTGVSENSLTLNIWSPKADTKGRPVLFFIHGGSFTHGAGSETFYNGAFLAKTWDVVVVTINYRLGIFGFADFSEIDPSFAGNCGVRDVLLALQWVHSHIADFGGDPNAITLFGQSSGATMVATLATLPPQARLFQRCIVMSGGPTQVQSKEECRATSNAFLEFAHSTEPGRLLSLSLEELIKMQREFIKWYGLGAATFRITADGDVIPDFPIPAARRKATAPIPLLIGTTKEEMAFMAIKPLNRFINVKKITEEGFQQETEKTRAMIRNAYVERYGERRGIPMLYTDLLFRIASVWFAEAASPYSDVWMYRFDYETTMLRMNGLHAFHSTDIPYVFGNFKSVLVRPMFIIVREMEQVLTVSHDIQQDFITFARTGKLDWQQCDVNHTPAKCYDSEHSIQPIIDPQIKELYKKTRYWKRSMHGSPVC